MLFKSFLFVKHWNNLEKNGNLRRTSYPKNFTAQCFSHLYYGSGVWFREHINQQLKKPERVSTLQSTVLRKSEGLISQG